MFGLAVSAFFFVRFYSNVAAGRLFGIPLRGTHSHAFVSSFMVGNPYRQFKLSIFAFCSYDEQFQIIVI